MALWLLTGLGIPRAAAQPANDDFANRTRIEDGRPSISGSLLRSTWEPFEISPTSPGTGQGSVWFEWVAPATGQWTVATLPSNDPGPAFTLWRGSDPATLVRAATDSLRGNRVQLTAGDRLILQVAGPSVPAIYFTLLLSLPPSNDNFADRSELYGEEPIFVIDTFSATTEPGETGVADDSWATTWYEWVPRETGSYHVSGTVEVQSMASVRVDLMQGEALNRLTVLRTFHYDSWSSNPRPARGFFAIGGQPYLFRVQSYAGVPVSGALKLGKAPPYNGFAQRKTLSGANVTEPFTANADFGEPGEPQWGPGPARATTWWDWTCPTSGGYQLSSDPGSLIAVLRGSSLSQLEVVGRDDGVVPGPWNLGASGLAFQVVEGERLVFMVDRWWADTLFTGTLRLTPTAASDAFQHPIRLAGTPIVTNFPIFLTTSEPGEPDIGRSRTGSRWFRWTAAADGNVGVSVGAAGGWVTLDVFEGDSLETLVRRAGAPASTNASIVANLQARAGVDYAIRVTTPSASDSGYWGRLDLSLTPAAANDRFESREILSLTRPDGVFGANGTTVGALREPWEPGDLPETGAASVWYCWVAPQSGRFHASIEKRSGQSARYITVFRGSSPGTLEPVSPLRHRNLPSLEDFRFQAEQGTEYAIRVQTPLDEVRNFFLALSPSPVNDDFAERTLLSGSLATSQTSLTGATAEPLDPVPYSVWWRWIAPADGICEVELQSAEPQFYPSGVLYSVLGENRLTHIGSAPSGLTNRVRFQTRVAAGREYAIAAGGQGFPETRLMVLNLRLTPSPNPVLGGTWIPDGWEFAVEGKDRWSRQDEVRHEGSEAVMVNLEADRTHGLLHTTLIGPGTLSFWWKVDARYLLTFDSYDVGAVFLLVNGSFTAAVEGYADWTRGSLYLPEGVHDVAWGGYGFLLGGHAGFGWLSDIQFEPAARPGALTLQRTGLNQLRLVFDYSTGIPYAIQRSTNLRDWESWLSPEDLERRSFAIPGFFQRRLEVPVDLPLGPSGFFYRAFAQ